MATSPQNKTARKEDLISGLPEDVKQMILERLPTPDAARTSVLSTHWNHVWLRHGRLAFDGYFYHCLLKCNADNDDAAIANLINNILLNRVGPVEKFALYLEHWNCNPYQSDLDQWCHFLSTNGLQELKLVVPGGDNSYKLPSCIVLCPTIKQLYVRYFNLHLPINARIIFPGVTSLVFNGVDFSDTTFQCADMMFLDWF
nr:F-box/FBD/LRR-repeat protein At1g13570-like [Ipomoea trifida]